MFDRSASLQPLWKQVEGFTEAIYPIMQNAADGVHLICYSQGGLVCRGILSTLPDHNVHSFISLSSPQAGQYGDTEYLKYLFPQFVKSNLYHVCYTAVGQKISICNYWNDPHHRDMYINSSDYLALLDNEKANPNSTAWKQNFLRIKKLVLIGGADDGVITPWQSSQFGFYDENETVVEMKNQKIEKCPMLSRGQTNLLGGVLKCICGFHTPKPTASPTGPAQRVVEQPAAAAGTAKKAMEQSQPDPQPQPTAPVAARVAAQLSM
ncbi:lysosomal thioesterase PPT2-A-like, partial [Sinocyclocheilus rhinocerous]|uniref:lysosomal thioesterase PPT2-A-like n=1 Tax=Sinocyclocheilus rhinocerous TaxID=307959 RepID=UPI0007B8124D